MSNGRCCCNVFLHYATLYDKVSPFGYTWTSMYPWSMDRGALIPSVHCSYFSIVQKPHLGALNINKLPIIMHYGYDKMAIEIQIAADQTRSGSVVVRSGF